MDRKGFSRLYSSLCETYRYRKTRKKQDQFWIELGNTAYMTVWNNRNGLNYGIELQGYVFLKEEQLEQLKKDYNEIKEFCSTFDDSDFIMGILEYDKDSDIL